MTRPTFRQQCRILGELWVLCREDAEMMEEWSNFLSENDLGTLLAFSFSSGLVASPVDEAIDLVNESYEDFCSLAGIDPLVSFATASDALAESDAPTRPVEHSRERRTDTLASEAANQTGISDLIITKGAWTGISSACRARGMSEVSIRLYALECECGDPHFGCLLVEEPDARDVMNEGSWGRLHVDPGSAQLLSGVKVEFGGTPHPLVGNELTGLVFRAAGRVTCRCGSEWRPTKRSAKLLRSFGRNTEKYAANNPEQGGAPESSPSTSRDGRGVLGSRGILGF